MIKSQTITKKQLRTFGITLTVFLSVIGLIHFLKGNISSQYWFWAVAAGILLVTLLTPLVIKPIYRGAMFIAHLLGWINTRIILGLIYYLLFSPVSLVMKIIGRDPLQRQLNKEVKTYWKIREKIARSKDQYLRQF